MADDFGGSGSSVWKLGAAHPSALELWHTVDTIEETKKFDAVDRSAEGLAELAHVFERLLFLPLLGGVVFSSHLPGASSALMPHTRDRTWLSQAFRADTNHLANVFHTASFVSHRWLYMMKS